MILGDSRLIRMLPAEFPNVKVTLELEEVFRLHIVVLLFGSVCPQEIIKSSPTKIDGFQVSRLLKKCRRRTMGLILYLQISREIMAKITNTRQFPSENMTTNQIFLFCLSRFT
jgi:hypothetical protein